jgi:hypothetical protein
VPDWVVVPGLGHLAPLEVVEEVNVQVPTKALGFPLGDPPELLPLLLPELLPLLLPELLPLLLPELPPPPPVPPSGSGSMPTICAHPQSAKTLSAVVPAAIALRLSFIRTSPEA